MRVSVCVTCCGARDPFTILHRPLLPQDRVIGSTQLCFGGGRHPQPSPSRAPSLCTATVSLTAGASLNGIRNRQ